jgi:hypothetical protein
VSILLLNACASILLPLAMTMAVNAAEPSGQSHPCTTVVDPAERLACYDAAFPPASGVRSGAVDVEAERARALKNFGLNKLQVNERQPQPLRDLEPERIEAKVVRVINRATGERAVTLDNGQTWLLTEVTSKGRLKPGDSVAVRTAALGTFMMVTPSRAALRAKRIN